MTRPLSRFTWVALLALGIWSCTSEPEKSAKFEVQGDLTASMDPLVDIPEILGTVKNVGDKEGSGCIVEITLYNGNTIIDDGLDFLPDLPPGVSANFDVDFFEINSHDEYDRYEIEFSCISG